MIIASNKTGKNFKIQIEKQGRSSTKINQDSSGLLKINQSPQEFFATHARITLCHTFGVQFDFSD